MKSLILPVILFISGIISGQQIAGKWYSKDSTRVYLIYQSDDHFEAILEKSSRKKDKEGVIILRQVTSRGKKSGFEGEIYTVDGFSTLANIRVVEDGRVLRLRLRRMFFMNVTIKWYRVERRERHKYYE